MRKLFILFVSFVSISISFNMLISRSIALEKQQSSTIKQMIRVSPVLLKVRLMPGKIQYYKIKVDNLLEIPLPLQATVEGFDASDEEYGLRAPGNTTDQVSEISSPLMNWITLKDTDAILPAKSSKEFDVAIHVPKSVSFGGYYAVIFFTPVFPGVPINSRIGVVALANIGVQSQKNNGEIVTFRFDKAYYEKGPFEATVRVKNTSLNYFTAKPTLIIKPLFGAEQTYDLEEKTILPGKIRRWQRVFAAGDFYKGIYQAKLALSMEKGDYIYSSFYFIGFPVSKALVVIIGVIVSFYLLLNRKRIIRALRVLLRG